MNPITNSIDVIVCRDADHATELGHIYTPPKKFTSVRIIRAVVIQNGMVSGKPSVDLVMRDASGNEYVAMLGAELLKSRSKWLIHSCCFL